MNTITLSYLSRQLLFAISLLCLAAPALAGKLYRYMDGDTQVLSHRLPASAAQSGYDILDSKTFRLIEHVKPALSTEALAAKYALKEQSKIKELMLIQQQQAKKEQDKYDRKLLATYQSEQDLIERRDAALSYRQNTITKTEKKQVKLKDYLVKLQTQAAKNEIAGEALSKNHRKQLQIAEQQLSYNNEVLIRLNKEITELNAQYDMQLERLQFLLSPKPE